MPTEHDTTAENYTATNIEEFTEETKNKAAKELRALFIAAMDRNEKREKRRNLIETISRIAMVTALFMAYLDNNVFLALVIGLTMFWLELAAKNQK